MAAPSRLPADPPPTPRAAARDLLDRPPMPGYLEVWARALRRPLFDSSALGDLAGLVFRLGDERYLLPTTCVREVHRPARVHRVPGRTGEVFRGLACLRGELHLCFDLHALLGAERAAAALSGESGAKPASGGAGVAAARMVVIEKDGARWAFEADEVLDVRRYVGAKVAAPQVTVQKSAVHFTDGLADLGDGRAARLDPERLFAGLARSLA